MENCHFHPAQSAAQMSVCHIRTVLLNQTDYRPIESYFLCMYVLYVLYKYVRVHTHIAEPWQGVPMS